MDNIINVINLRFIVPVRHVIMFDDAYWLQGDSNRPQLKHKDKSFVVDSAQDV